MQNRLPQLLCCIFFLILSPQLKAQLPPLHVDGNKIKDPDGKNIVLRGVSYEYLEFQASASIGINGLTDILVNENDASSNSPGWYTRIVRLPVHPEAYLANPTGYLNNYIKPAVDHATAQNLYVIIDWHYVDDTHAHVQATTDFWNAIAPVFADYDNVMYELYNEPINQGEDWSILKGQMQGWYNTVRSHAPNNLVLVGTREWDQHPEEAMADPLTGTNIVYILHVYANHWPWIQNRVQTAAAGVPILMTEWGFRMGLGWDTDETRNEFGIPLLNLAEDLDIGWTAWCASDDFEPRMFNADWSLRVGQDEMGGFVKDWLYEYRDADWVTIGNGPFPINVEVSGAGEVILDPDKALYDRGEVVQVMAVPGAGAVFIGWSGAVQDPGQALTQIEVTGTMAITARFVEPFSVPGTIEAEEFTHAEGVQIEASTEGGQNVGYIDIGDFMEYMVNVEQPGEYLVEFRVASEAATGEFEFLIDGIAKGILDVPNTGGWQAWETHGLTSPLDLEEGIFTIRIDATGAPFNVNWITLSRLDCNQDPGGDAVLDSCGICAGGNTGIVPEFDPTNCVVATTENKEVVTELSVYPNPSSGKVIVEAKEAGVLKILNVQGIAGFSETVAEGTFSEVHDLKPGVYLFTLQTKSGLHQRRVLIE